MKTRLLSISDRTKIFTREGDNMEKKSASTVQTERKIGNTTYVVTSHFLDEGSTAVDKIKRLIDIDTKTTKYGKKV